MSIFSTWLLDRMAQRGMSPRDLAVALETGDTTVHGWLHQDVIPSTHHLVQLHRIFDVPIATVLEQAGYDIQPSKDEGEREMRRARMLARIPAYVRVGAKVSRLSPEKQDAYLSAMERLLPPGDPDDEEV